MCALKTDKKFRRVEKIQMDRVVHKDQEFETSLLHNKFKATLHFIRPHLKIK